MTDETRALAALQAADAAETTPDDAMVRRLRETMAALDAFAPSGRGVCPSHDDLVRFHDGDLPTDEAARCRAHLEVCGLCASDLADLRALTCPPLLELAARVAEAGVELLRHSFAATAQPVPAPARGAASPAVELAAVEEGLSVAVRLTGTGGESADVRLTLDRQESPLRQARVSLFRDDHLLESRVLAGSEEIAFAEVPPGDYTICVSPTDGDDLARLAVSIEAASTASR